MAKLFNVKCPGGMLMVPRFNCRSDRYNEYMFTEEGGEYVKAAAYDELLALLKKVGDVLKTSIPLRGDHRHSQVLIQIETALEES
jgi:hypothetical protein